MFLAWLTLYNYQKLRLFQFTPAMAQAYLDCLLVEKGYSGKTHNNQHGILHSFFGAMMIPGRKWIDANPFAGVVMLPEDQGDNIPYTEKERADITKYLRENDKRIYYAINFLFHCYIRKTELTTIRVGDIDWINKTIKINSQASKNRIQDSVAIPEAFLPILLEMGLDMAPKHFYVFGKKMGTCADRMTRPDDISDRYLHLKISMGYEAGDGKTFYSWKHTGAIAYWNLLKDPYALMRQLRHGDLKTTMVYLRSLGLNPNFHFLNANVAL
jgi:integrase